MTSRPDARPSAVIGALGERLRRLDLSRLPVTTRVMLGTLWASGLIVIVVLLIPGALDGISAHPDGHGLTAFDAPLWFRVLATAIGGVLCAGIALLIAAPSPRKVAGIVLVIAGSSLPALLLLAEQEWIFAAPAVAAAAASGALLRRRPGRPVVVALCSAGGWLILCGYQFTPSGSELDSWVWITIFGFTAAFAAFGAYYGVASAAESRSRAVTALFRERWHPVVILGVAILAAMIVVLRLTVARDLFPDPDPELWTPGGKSWLSWALAGVVSGVLLAVAIRSTSRPLWRIGQRSTTASLAGLGNLNLAMSAVIIFVGLVGAVFGAVTVPVEWASVVPALKVVGLVLLGLVVLLPHFRRTAGRWLSIVALLFLLPQTTFGLLASWRVELADWLQGYPPTPVQVTILLVGAAVVLGVLGVVVPERRRVRPSLVARLAIVPLVAVHAGWLLPAVWTQFGLAVLVVGLLIAVLFAQPQPTRDRRSDGAEMVKIALLQLLGLTVTMLAAPSLLDDPSLIVLGLIWLSVVLVAALCFETSEPPPRAEKKGAFVQYPAGRRLRGDDQRL